ncbi:MAG: hypothetical protein EUB_01133 [Eubacterium sp.]|uniref:hypothetical protein n=1 Tax=Eubacterium sp. TaxID=142586 RepID=UPI0026DF441B|nr:hypothetical protein [Eubacterium sp.]MDO5432600.1 hypothetical protein [Eubacterium sp.]
MLNGLLGMLASGFAGAGLAMHQILKRKGENRRYRLVTGWFALLAGAFGVYVSPEGTGAFLLSLISFVTALTIMCCMCAAGNAAENERSKEMQED